MVSFITIIIFCEKKKDFNKVSLLASRDVSGAARRHFNGSGALATSMMMCFVGKGGGAARWKTDTPIQTKKPTKQHT